MACIHYWFCQLWVLPKWGSVYSGVSPAGWLSICNRSTCESGNMPFFPRRIVSIIGSFNSGFCSLLVLSTLEFGYLGVCLLGFCTLGNPCKCYSVNWGLCQGLVVFTLDSAPSWFCLLVIMSKQDFFNWDPVYFALCPLGSLSTLTLYTLESGHMTFSPRRVVSTIGSVNSGFCSRLVLSTWNSGPTGCLSTLIQSTWESGHMTFCPLRIVSTKGFVNSGYCLGLLLSTWASVHLGVYLLGFCPLAGLFKIGPLGSLATWHSSHVGLFPLLFLSTLDCAQFWFCLLGSPFNWDFIYFASVHS